MRIKIYLIVLSAALFVGWGKTGHKIINQKSIESFPVQIFFLKNWSNIIVNHASDADNRKSSDPTESPKHYIDIDEYSEFLSNGKIVEDYDSLVSVYGEGKIIDRGILPWAIIRTCESLKIAFEEKNWDKAMLIASDLGHYVGDAHMPLHITTNYNGQLTNQSGVHSRYESTMIGNYSSQIIYSGIQSEYIADISNYTFAFIYNNYKYVDSVLIADKESKVIALGSYNSIYYDNLWKKTKGFTNYLFSNASYRLSNLIYTCWINAGSPTIVGVDDELAELNSFKLYQNYPNPFNPTTTIKYSIPQNVNGETSNVKLIVYDILGREVATLVNESKSAGNYEVKFNTEEVSSLSSGVYFYKLQVMFIDRQSGMFTETKKMILLR